MKRLRSISSRTSDASVPGQNPLQNRAQFFACHPSITIAPRRQLAMIGHARTGTQNTTQLTGIWAGAHRLGRAGTARFQKSMASDGAIEFGISTMLETGALWAWWLRWSAFILCNYLAPRYEPKTGEIKECGHEL